MLKTKLKIAVNRNITSLVNLLMSKKGGVL